MLISIILCVFIITPTTLAVIVEPSLPALLTSIPLFSLPIVFPSPVTVRNPALDLQIRNTLSHYPLAAGPRAAGP